VAADPPAVAMESVFAVEAPHAVEVSSAVDATIFRFESARANHW
jgi:hypothetical protein